MKLTTLLLTSLSLLTQAQADQLSVQAVRLDAPQGAGISLPGFTGKLAAQDAQDITRRMIAWSGSEEPLMSVFLRGTLTGEKLSFQGQVDTSLVMQVNPVTGDISFQCDPAGIDLALDTPGLPQGQEAVRVALHHLQGLGLLPENPLELIVRHIGGERMAIVDNDLVQEFDKITTVHFGRRIGGFDVGGPGSKIIVRLGENGRLVGLTRRWQELELVEGSTERTISTTTIPALVKRDLAKTHSQAQSIEAGAPQIGFYDDGKGCIEPAWFTVAKVSYDQTVHPFAEGAEPLRALSVVPALRAAKIDVYQQERARFEPSHLADSAILSEGEND